MPELAFAIDGVSSLFKKPVARSDFESALSGLGIGIVKESNISWKLQVPESRPELFLEVGISRAVEHFLGLEKASAQGLEASASGVEVSLSSGESSSFPFLSCAVVSGLSLEMEDIESLSRFGNTIRKWAIREGFPASISFHDISKATPPFTCEPMEANSIKPFCPTGRYKEMTLAAILKEAKEKEENGKEDTFFPIEAGCEVACFSDSSGSVIAIPPMAENRNFALTEDTTNVLILSSGLSQALVDRVLAAAASNLVGMGGKLGQVAIASSGNLKNTPSVEPRTIVMPLDTVYSLVGMEPESERIEAALSRLGFFDIVVDAKNDRLSVSLPYFRADIAGPGDVAAALLSGLGYATIMQDIPARTLFGSTSGRLRTPSLLRDVLVGHGFTETISSPSKTEEDSIPYRKDILSGLLILLSGSRDSQTPQKVFEFGIVDAGGKRKTHAAGVFLDVTETSFWDIKSVISSLLSAVGADWKVAPYGGNLYISGRCAEIIVSSSNAVIGHFGEIHPKILEAHTLHYPVTAFELDLSML